MAFTRLTASFALAFLACVGAWALFAVSILEDHWFEASVTEQSLRLGLNNLCVNNQCNPHNFTGDLDLTKCTQSGSEYKFRFDGVKIALYTSGGFSVLASLINLMAICLEATKILYLGQFLMMLAFIAAALAVSFFWATMESWLFCDLSYCEWYAEIYGSQDRPCVYFFGFSFALAACGVILFLLSVLWSGFTLVAAASSSNGDDDDDDELDKTTRSSLGGTRGGTGGAQTRSTLTPQNNTTADEESYEGYYQEEQNDGTMAWIPNGYYWDDGSQMYFSEESGYYYDPKEEKYYDSESDTWFAM